MALIDYILLLLAAGGILYGSLRGLRSSLFLLITLLADLLLVILLVRPFESLLLIISPLDSEVYYGAPAVAAFLLEGEKVFAFLAALFPAIVTVFAFLILIFGSYLLKPVISAVQRGWASRVAGAVCGLLAGFTAIVILGIQLIRLPWPPSVTLFRGSIIYSALETFAGGLIPMAAGGWPYV